MIYDKITKDGVKVGYEEYKNVILDILDKMPVLYTAQLELALMRYDEDLNRKTAHSILYAIQRNGYLLMNKAGWSMTKAAYIHMTGDKFLDSVMFHADYRIDDLLDIYVFSPEKKGIIASKPVEKLISNKRKNDINLMWVIADMYPESAGFVKANPPFNFTFLSEGYFDEETQREEPGICYELMYMPSINEDAMIAMLRSIPPIKDKDIRNSLERVVIMENKDHDFKIPALGFSFIGALDNTKECHYSEIRRVDDKEKWNDLRS